MAFRLRCYLMNSEITFRKNKICALLIISGLPNHLPFFILRSFFTQINRFIGPFVKLNVEQIRFA
jgi:hypothetical protein